MMFSIPGFIFLAGTVLFVAMWYRESRCSLIFTPFLVFSINDIARNWIAALVAPTRGLTPDFYSLYLFIGAYAVFVLAFMSVTAAIGQSKSLPFEYRKRPVLMRVENAEFMVVLIAAVALTALSLRFFGGMPITLRAAMEFLSGGTDARTVLAVGQTREFLTKSHVFGGAYAGQGLILIVLRTCWPLVVGVALLRWREARTLRWAVLTAVTLALALIFVGGDGTRGPLLWSLILLLVMVSIVRPIPRWYMFAGAAGLFLVAVSLSVISPKLSRALGNDQFWLIALQTIADRAFLGNGIDSILIIDLVRDGTWDLRLGAAHVQKFISALPGAAGGPPLAYELFKEMAPRSRETTFASATYLAEAYVDLGIVGVLTGYAFGGMLVATVQHWVFSRPKSLLTVPFIAFLILTVGRFPLVGPITLISTTAIAAVGTLMLWIGYSVLMAVGGRPVRNPAVAETPSTVVR